MGRTVTLLAAVGLRVAIDDVIATERFDLSTTGDRLLLVGDVSPLMALLLGMPTKQLEDEERPPVGWARIASGSLAVLGLDVTNGAYAAETGMAPLDPPLPPDWSAADYVTWSARLSTLGKTSASRAVEALERVGLAKAGKRSTASLAIPERRALVLAAAYVSSPKVLIAEAPLRGLDANGSAFVLAALGSVTDGRSAIVSSDRLVAGSPEMFIAKQASDVAYFARGELLTKGTPPIVFGAGRLYGLTVRHNADALRDELSRRGIEMRGGPLRFSVTLPEGATPTDVLVAADVASASVVEISEL